MRLVHKWSSEKARRVCQLFNLRKPYQWRIEKPKRLKESTKCNDVSTGKKKKKDYHVVRSCPVMGCLATTIKMSAHLTGYHKMEKDCEYYQLLTEAKPHVPFTNDVRKCLIESLKRKEERKTLIAASLENDRNLAFQVESNVQENVPRGTKIRSNSADMSGYSSEMEVTEPEIELSEVDSVMAKFLNHIMSPDGGKRERKSSLQSVREVRTIVSVLDNKVENLLDRYLVRDKFFRDHLDKKCKPGTSKHYMSSLIAFMDFAISDNLHLPACTCEDFVSMKLRIHNWRKVYNKQIEEQRWVNEVDDLEVLVTPEQCANFEQGELARSAVKLFGRVTEERNFSPSLLEYTNMRDFNITTIALANAHRSGVSANLQMKEFKKATLDSKSGNFLINVMKHKTVRKHGPAVICLSAQKFRFLEIFVENVRNKIPANCDNVFLSWNGNSMESGAVSKQINSIWKRSGVYGENVPPKKNICTTVIRKSVTTLVHDQQEKDIQPLADLLAHNLQTAKNVYRMRNREKQAITGSAAISNVLHGSSTEPTKSREVSYSEPGPIATTTKSPRLRLPWTTEEEEEVKNVFADEITNKEVSQANVRSKMAKLIICQRYEKQVYDKIRTIICLNRYDCAMELPTEEETLSDRIGRLKSTTYENEEDACHDIQQNENLEDVHSIIATSEFSRLKGLQKLFDTSESEEIKTLCHHIALSGPISIDRIQDALSKTELGTTVLKRYEIIQIQTRVKYERRQYRKLCTVKPRT